MWGTTATTAATKLVVGGTIKTAATKLVVGGTVKTAFVAGGAKFGMMAIFGPGVLICGAVAYGITKYVEAGL
jgi:hypothetical protein